MTKLELNTLYQSLSQVQIANKLGVSRRKIQQLFAIYNIPARSYADASSFMNNQRTIMFTKQQEQLIYGSLLGDACLCRSWMKSNKTDNKFSILKLHFSHCIDQLSYLKHKRSILPGSIIGTRLSGLGSIMKYYSFCHTPSLRPVEQLCHNENHKKRITRNWLDKVDWEGIAFWYQDDGDLIINRKQPIVRFHTESYSFDELDLLQDFLRQRGLDTRLAPSPNVNPNERIITSRHKHQAIQFLKIISKYIIPHFRYKIRILNDV